MIQRAIYLFGLLMFGCILLQPAYLLATDTGREDIIVQLPKSKGSIYQLLNGVSKQSGYMFIYDSQLFDNDKIVKIPAGKYSLLDAVHAITGKNNLSFRIVGEH